MKTTAPMNFLHQSAKRLNYFGDHSSLHGMRHILSTKPIHPLKRLIWLSLVGFSCFGMLYILHQASELFRTQAVSFVPETTYLQWNTDFPAVTVCESLDFDKLKDYYEENDIPIHMTTFYQEIIFLDSAHYCRSCKTCVQENMKCPENFTSIMKSFRSPCNETLQRCSWRGKPFNCCDRFLSISTEFGECFVFNSAHFETEKLHLSNLSTGPGYLKFTAMESVLIDVHAPDDVIFSNFDKQMINENDADVSFVSELELRFKVVETYNEIELHTLPAEVRGCLFAHEEVDSHSMYGHYSYSACIVKCRATRQLATCNCTHYMLPRMGAEPHCDIQGLICLTDLIENSDADDADMHCNCLPSCEEPTYHTVSFKNLHNTGALTDELIERGSLISIYMECLPTTRIHRLVVRTSLDYVVFIGGTAGVFFGASILSVIEVIYLLFIRKQENNNTNEN